MILDAQSDEEVIDDAAQVDDQPLQCVAMTQPVVSLSTTATTQLNVLTLAVLQNPVLEPRQSIAPLAIHQPVSFDVVGKQSTSLITISLAFHLVRVANR